MRSWSRVELYCYGYSCRPWANTASLVRSCRELLSSTGPPSNLESFSSQMPPCNPQVLWLPLASQSLPSEGQTQTTKVRWNTGARLTMHACSSHSNHKSWHNRPTCDFSCVKDQFHINFTTDALYYPISGMSVWMVIILLYHRRSDTVIRPPLSLLSRLERAWERG